MAGGARRRWTAKEIAHAAALRLAGQTQRQIAAALGRHQSSVKKKLASLAAVPRPAPIAKRRAAALPVAQSDWLRPPTKAQLMAGRA